MIFDIAIIGGGLSGLSAAIEIALNGGSVAIIEQAPRLGGRCYSYVDSKTGDIVDNGQHVLLGAYHNLFRYLDLIGTRSFLRKEPALRLPLHHPTKGRVTFEILSLPKPFHLTAGMLKFRILSLRDRQRLVKVGLALNKWNNAIQRELASLTIERWLANLHQSEEVRRSFWYPIAVSVMNETPDRACALLFARVLRTAFLGKREDSAILVPTVGQTELYVTQAEKFLANRKAPILLNTEVESLIVKENRICGVRLKDGKELRAQNVVSTIPPYALAKIVPHEPRREVPFVHLPKYDSSPIISLHLWFDRRFMDVEYMGVIDRHIQWVFDRRRIVMDEGKTTGYISAVISGARGLIDLPKEKLVTFAVRDLHDVFPESQKARLIHSVVIKEKRATFSPTCEIEPIRPSPETPIKNFYLAGDWTNTGLPATIEGAVMSGFASAKLVC